MSHLLAIETSGKSLGVALCSEEGIVFEENVLAGSIHGKALGPLMKKALQSVGLKPAALSAVAISQGPGSWTGLRIGISAVKALAWGSGIGLIGVPSFAALATDAARHLSGESGGDILVNSGADISVCQAMSATPNSIVSHAFFLVVTLRDARSEGFFAAIFGVTSQGVERWMDDSVFSSDETILSVEKLSSAHPGQTVFICGDQKCLQAMAAPAHQRGWTLMHDCEHISARAVAECGWSRLKKNEAIKTATDIHRFSPLYLRASDPELKLGR